MAQPVSSATPFISPKAIISSYYSPTFYRVRGIVSLAFGGGIIYQSNSNGDLQVKTFQLNAKWLFGGGIACALFGVFSLGATAPRAKTAQELAGSSLGEVRKCEGAGDFRKGLQMARKGQEQFAKLGLATEAQQFEQMAKRLEDKLLTEGFSKILFDDTQKPRIKFVKLLEVVRMPALDATQNPIDQIDAWAQKNLLRPADTTRWDLQVGEFEKLEGEIKPIVAELGFLNEVLPSFQKYEGALVLGASLPAVRNRVNFLVKQWETGVRFSNLYFLTGERDLDPKLESNLDLVSDQRSSLKIRKDWKRPEEINFPKTEREMIELVWNQADLPKGMRELSVHFINAPKIANSDPKKVKPPRTCETVESWLATNPPTGSYLVISNAPYINRQDLTVRSLSPKAFKFDTVGEAAHKNEKVAIILDEIGRTIFETRKITQKKS